MADGHEQQIKDIKPGDKVRATDPETGKTQPRTVEKLITTKHDKDFATLTIRDGRKPSKIVATVTHPFWVTSAKKWINAGDIKTGMRLQAASGAAVPVVSVKIWRHQHLTHDLTVDVTHTYYVLAGATAVLVHNCNLGEYADSLRAGFNKTDGPFFAAKYTSPSGRTYFGHSGHDLTPAPGGEVDSLVRQFTPEGGRYHAGCAETMCLIQAEAAEGAAGIRGGSFEVVKVRGLNSPPGGAHGTPASPCALVCQPRLQHQEISFEGD